MLGGRARQGVRCDGISPRQVCCFATCAALTAESEHPGGPKIILKYAGRDATEEFEPIHPPDTLDKYLDASRHLGEVDMSTLRQEVKETDPDEAARQDRIRRMPILEQCYNLMDFEAVARRVMKKTAWAYYSSGADDEIVGQAVVQA